ncbi:MAG TPA: acyl-CoA dehydrogenase family protein [Solirubrobacteraceae bacterium]|nr:acyl-CoA dehydrogenase family protein [Solirubrobacteraceae bacterium]
MVTQTHSIGTGESPLSAARRLAPRAAELAEQSERERTLPQELVDELRAARLLSLCLPRSLGGREAQPGELITALEELARGDGACAWCAMIASTSSLLGAYLPVAEAELIFAGGANVTGGVFAPRGRAELREGAYVVSGRWAFTSGVQHCDWVLGGCVVHKGEEPELLANGAPDVRLMLMPADAVEVIDTWSVSGLRGTGSHDMVVGSVLVPATRGISLLTDAPRDDGPLYAFPLFGLLALGISAVALGIARGAVEDFLALAGAKTPAGGRRTLAERSTVQAELARNEAELRAARGLVLGEAERAWQAALEGGAIAERERVGLRMAASHATAIAARVTTAMYQAAGGTSIYDSSPLQRRFRDVHVATQHVMVAPATWELTGRLLLGLSTDTTQL